MNPERKQRRGSRERRGRRGSKHEPSHRASARHARTAVPSASLAAGHESARVVHVEREDERASGIGAVWATTGCRATRARRQRAAFGRTAIAWPPTGGDREKERKRESVKARGRVRGQESKTERKPRNGRAKGT